MDTVTHSFYFVFSRFYFLCPRVLFFLLVFAGLIRSQEVFGQVTNPATTLNASADFLLPSPQAGSLLQAHSPSINESSGSMNIQIPLASLSIPGYTLPMTLSYSSIGVAVDSYASMAGMGWDLNLGGVITRTVLDKPDEHRTSDNNNLTVPDYGLKNAAVLNFLENATDKQSDIFTVALPGFSAKFIIDVYDNPVFLEQNHYRIARVGASWLDGFVITSSEGVVYTFTEREVSVNRNPTGENCPKSFDFSSVTTSWYIKTIRTADTRSTLTFHYHTAPVQVEGSVTQTISSVRWSEDYPGGGGPAFTGSDDRCSTCIPLQEIATLYLDRIESSNGDAIHVDYDSSLREDLEGGKRLQNLRLVSRTGGTLQRVIFHSSYRTSTASIGGYRSKRLFLNEIIMDNGSGGGVPEKYTFSYEQPERIPPRGTYGQDLYGYANGKNSNPSLLPILESSDVNYSLYNNGTGSPLKVFGDRSIDTVFARSGLLTKITYPTGGFDSIRYRANRVGSGASTRLAGGSSVFEILSYSDATTLAFLRRYLYQYKNTGASSSLLLNPNPYFSYTNEIRRDGSGSTSCVGPMGIFGVVTSTPVMPYAALGTQHIYHRSVLVYDIDASGNRKGVQENQYRIFLGDMIYGQILQGEAIPGSPNQIVPQLVLGNELSRSYKTVGGSDILQYEKKVIYRVADLREYPNYVVKSKYVYGCPSTIPQPEEFEAYDVTRVFVNSFTVLVDSVLESHFEVGSSPTRKTEVYSYASSSHRYPTRVQTWRSDGREQRIDFLYAYEKGITFMLTKNLVSPVLEAQYYVGSELTKRSFQQFKNWFGDGKNIALEKAYELHATDTSNLLVFSQRDLQNNVNQVQVKRQQVVYLWGYGGQFPVAKIENATYSDVVGILGSSAISSLNMPLVSESTIVNTLQTLRGHPSMRKARVWSFVYQPMVGLTREIDPRGVSSYYRYDSRQRLEQILDEAQFIKRSFQYHYRP